MDSLKSIWNQMPVVRLILPFMAGIGICMEVDSLVILFAVLLIFSTSFIFYINWIKETARVYRLRYVSGAVMSLTMLAAGYVVTFLNTDRLDPHHISAYKNPEAVYIGVISDPPVIKDKTVSALIELRSVTAYDSSRAVTGKVLASIVKDDKSAALKYGDQILFSGAVKDYEEPRNPDQFDYKLYQSLHHIYQHAYLGKDEWKVTEPSQGNIVLAKIYTIRTYFLSLIKREVPGTNELAVATAIMLGYRDYVTDDVTQAYAGSGVLHVLSVSGLHVAVLYYVLNLLLGWMDKRRKLEIIKGILVVAIMLFYAGLTGLSPPVLRSVWMFTLIVIARLLDRDVSMYNVLGVSCLLLLLWDPYYIGDVGFQLSYIAVAGIVYLYPLIFDWIQNTDVARTNIKWLDLGVNWLTRWTWGLISVSIAAQLATFPISIFYFHRFPNFFLLSNILVIPMSNLVLISGMALFVVGWSDRLVSIIGWVFDHLLIGLNKIVFGIDALPYAMSNGVDITSFEMVLLYMVTGMLCWYIADKRGKVLAASLCFVLVLCTAFSIKSMKHDNQKQLVVYDIKGKKAIAFISGTTVYYDFDSAVIHDEMTMRYNVRDHWYASGVAAEVPMDSMRGGSDISFGKVYMMDGKRILIFNKASQRSMSHEKLKVDVIVLSADPDVSVKEINKQFVSSLLVFDSSNKPWRVKKWKAECDSLGIKYADCGDKAFVMEW